MAGLEVHPMVCTGRQSLRRHCLQSLCEVTWQGRGSPVGEIVVGEPEKTNSDDVSLAGEYEEGICVPEV